MLNVTGKASIYKIENKGNFSTATIRVGKKLQNGEWESMFFSGKLVGKAHTSCAGLQDKDKVEIKSAVLETSKPKDKTYTNVVIFEIVKEGQQESDDFYEDNSESDLPF